MHSKSVFRFCRNGSSRWSRSAPNDRRAIRTEPNFNPRTWRPTISGQASESDLTNSGSPCEWLHHSPLRMLHEAPERKTVVFNKNSRDNCRRDIEFGSFASELKSDQSPAATESPFQMIHARLRSARLHRPESRDGRLAFPHDLAFRCKLGESARRREVTLSFAA